MTECEELALTMVRQEPFKTLDDARAYVLQQMPDETATVIDNVAWVLFYSTKGDTNMKTITLATANAIVGKLGLEIRRASASERRDALYSGVDNPRWVIDSGCFKPHRAFGTVSEAFSYLCKREFIALQEIELTDKQRELVRHAVYGE